MSKLKDITYHEFYQSLESMINLNLEFLYENNKPLYKAFIYKMATLMISSESINRNNTGIKYYTPFDFLSKKESLDIIKNISYLKNVLLDEIQYDPKMYSYIISARKDVKSPYRPYFYQYARAEVRDPKTKRSYPLLSLNNSNMMEKIFDIGINHGQFSAQTIPLGGLYLSLLDDKGEETDTRVFYTGWIQESYSEETGMRAGRFDLSPRIAIEEEDEENFVAVSNSTVFPMFYMERIIHWYLPEEITVFSSEKFYQLSLCDKIKRLLYENRSADSVTNLPHIDISQFIDFKNSFAKYGEKLDNNPENCKKTLSRIIIIPANINNFISEYYNEGEGPSYHANISLIIGDYCDDQLKKRAALVRDSRSKGQRLSFYSKIKPKLQRKDDMDLYTFSLPYSTKESAPEYLYSKNIRNLELIKQSYGTGICGITSCDGSHYYNVLDYYNSGKSLGDIFADSSNFSPIDLKRACHFAGINLIQNSEQARTKGTYCCSEVALLDNVSSLKNARSKYFKDSNYYEHAYFSLMPHSNKVFYTPFAVLKYSKDNKIDLKATFAAILKGNVRIHSQITGKNLEVAPDTDINLKMYTESGEFIKDVVIDRTTNYLPGNSKDMNSQVNYFTNLLSAFIHNPKTLDPSFIIQKEVNGKMIDIFDSEKIDNLSDQEYIKFVRYLDGIDGQGRISPEVAAIPAVRQPTITLPVDECFRTPLLRHIMRTIDKEPLHMNFEEGFVYPDDETGEEIIIKAKNFKSDFKLSYDLKCQEDMCNGLLYPADKVVNSIEETEDFLIDRENLFQADKNSPNFRAHGLYLKCEKCGSVHKVDTPEAFDKIIGNRTINPLAKYSANYIVFTHYDIDEKGLNLYCNLYAPSGESRSVDISLKAVRLTMHQDYIGYFESPMINPETGEKVILKGKLDMNTIGLSNKAKDNGQVIWFNNYYNALFPDHAIHFNDIVEETYNDQYRELYEEMAKEGAELPGTDILNTAEKKLNKFLDENLMPATITKKFLDPETGEECWIKIKATMMLHQTRVSEMWEEYIWAGTKDYARFSAMHTIFLDDLGEQDLCQALYEAREVGNIEDLTFFEEFLKIVNHDKTPGVYNTIKKPEFHLFDILELDENDDITIQPNVFVREIAQNIKVSSIISEEEWEELLTKHNLFTDDKYKDGFVVHIPNHAYDGISNSLKDSVFIKEHHKYLDLVFPSRKFFMNKRMVTMLPNRKVRLSNSFRDFLRTFFTLSANTKRMYDLIAGNPARNIHGLIKEIRRNGDVLSKKILRDRLLMKVIDPKNYSFNNFKHALSSPMKSLRMELEKKKSFVDELTAFTLPYFSAKQVGGSYIEPGQAVIGNLYFWRKQVRHQMSKLYSDSIGIESQIKAALNDPQNIFIIEEVRKHFRNKELITEGDIKFFLDWYQLYGYANRDPNIFGIQAIAGSVHLLNIKQVNEYFMKHYKNVDGKELRFSDIYPDFKGIMINNLDMVAGFQSDTDGDHIRIMVPATLKSQFELKKFVSKHKAMNILRKAKSEDPAYAIHEFQYEWSMTYLLDEYQSLCYKGDCRVNYNPEEDYHSPRLSIRDNIADQDRVNRTIHQGTENKTLIGTLTTSGWLFYLMFMMAKKMNLANKNHITDLDFKRMAHFFQVLLQDGCIRGLKAAAQLQHCTADNLAMNNTVVIYDPISDTTSTRLARDLFRKFAEDFELLYNIEGLTKAIHKMFTICDWWREVGGFKEKEVDNLDELMNRYVKDNASMKPIGALLNSIKSLLFSTSSSFQGQLDDSNGEEFYLNFQIKDENTGEYLINNLSIMKYYSDILDVLLNIKYYGFETAKEKIQQVKEIQKKEAL